MDGLLLASWIARESVRRAAGAAGPDSLGPERFDLDLGRPGSARSGDVRPGLLARRRAGAARALHRLADTIGPARTAAPVRAGAAACAGTPVRPVVG